MAFSEVSRAVKIFFAYAVGEQRDEELFQQLLDHLSSLKIEGLIEDYCEKMIAAGENWRQAVDDYFSNADIIIFLLSAQFLASKYFRNEDVQKAYERFQAGKTYVFAIRLYSVNLKGLLFESFRFLPRDGKPISEQRKKNTILSEVADELRNAVNDLLGSFVRKRGPQFPLWSVPYDSNPFFTGHQEIFTKLHHHFTENKSPYRHIQALTGLDGIGKTQLAIEYAYRYKHEYQAIFWVRCMSNGFFSEDITMIAALLCFPEKDHRDEKRLLTLVRDWLQQHDKWLLVIDNLEDFSLINQIVPPQRKGHVLVTTHQQATGNYATPIAVPLLTEHDGAVFLLRRAKIIGLEEAQEGESSENYTQARAIARTLGRLPLALDQAEAFIEETGSRLNIYLKRYQQEKERKVLLQWHGPSMSLRQESVKATLTLAFDKMNSLAMDLLRLFSFLQCDSIPEEILENIPYDPYIHLYLHISNLINLDGAIALLLRYSLIYRHGDTDTLNIHRIVQVIVKDGLPEKRRRNWALFVVHLINGIFPQVDYSTWPICQRYFPHAQMCVQHIIDFDFVDAEAAQLLHRLGIYSYERGDYTESEKYLVQALSIRKELLGDENLDTAQSLDALAILFSRKSDFEQAERFQRQALNIYEQALGPDHPETVHILNNLALLYRDQGRYLLAKPLFQQVLKIYEQNLNIDPIRMATTLNNLALLYHDQGEYKQAEPLYKQALTLRERSLPLGHPDLAQSLNNLAVLYQDLEKLDLAEQLLQRALQFYEDASGPQHPDTALCLNNLATVQRRQGNYEHAEKLYLRAITIYEHAFGPVHYELATSLNNLAFLYCEQKNYYRAEGLYLRACSIYEQTYQTEHPNLAATLNNLSDIYLCQKQYSEAEKTLIHALAICEQAVGSDPSDTVSVLTSLADLYSIQSQYQQAASFYQRALNINEQILGREHHIIIDMHKKHAHLLELSQQ